MTKKALIMLLAICMIVGMVPANNVVNAKTTDGSYAAKVIDSLGIMKTVGKKNASADDYVTRTEYAQMLINLSVYKDTVSSNVDVSLFKDVKKAYKGAAYIEFAVSQEWMSGYLNGTFKPEQAITLQEAINGVIHLLGYMDSDFTSNREEAKMALYTSMKLDENITKTKKQKLTRADCANLFYNTFTAVTKDNILYASKLGYKINSDGEVEYLSIVNGEMDGPIIADFNWTAKIPFDVDTATYYRDDNISTKSTIQNQDVLYYSSKLKMIWAYSEKVTGVLKKVSPSRLNPEEITLGNHTYEISGEEMAYRFSTQGGLEVGDVITILLGKDDKIVGVLTKEN